MNLYLIGLILACFADVATTAANLKAGGVELNPVARALMKLGNPLVVMIATKAVMVGLAVWINQPAFYVCLAAINLAAAVWNWAHRKK